MKKSENKKPGFELDCLVAEKVMGWMWYTAAGSSFLLPPWAHAYCDDLHIHWQFGKSGRVDRIENRYTDHNNWQMLAFSEDIEAASTILAEMNRKKFDYKIYSNMASGEMYWCAFFPVPDSGFFGMGASRQNPSHAICLAALDVYERLDTKNQNQHKPEKAK